MSDAPAPLTPAECDLRDFQFMPIDIVRLFGSRFHAVATDAEWRAGITLWLKSFHQVPAASIPDDDVELARLAELGRDLKSWRKFKAGALRGWVKCSDGLLYHPVVAEKALTSWKGKLEQRHRTECSRIKKANQRNGTDLPCPSFDAFVSSNFPQSVPFVSPRTAQIVPREMPSKGEGEGEGEGEYKEKKEALQPIDADEPPGPAASEASKSYAFPGITIRLNDLDLARWRKTYHAILDLDAELNSIDAWWQAQPEEKRKNWFHATAGMLNRKHQEALKVTKAAVSGDWEIPLV